jgi:hypothetical protein
MLCVILLDQLNYLEDNFIYVVDDLVVFTQIWQAND